MEAEAARNDPQSHPVPGVPDQLRKNIDGVGKGDHKTLLHIAAKNADVPLAYEIIRMGITIDFKDKDGVTPLFLALENVLLSHTILKIVSLPGFADLVAPPMRSLQDSLSCSSYVPGPRQLA